MNFNEHSKLNGQHAFLSASGYHWLNYDTEKLISTWHNKQAIQEGTELHELAANLIAHGLNLSRKNKTINLYVNDAIKLGLKPEVVLYYSDNCFGTADAIKFEGNTLRIHDLKTGKTPAKMEQLEIYAALFCLEYFKKPEDIDIYLRIYQSNEVLCYEPEASEIREIMDKIVYFDEVIDQLKLDKEIF